MIGSFNRPFALEQRMNPDKAVNLDAMIPRADFGGGEDIRSGGQPRSTISIQDLDDGFFLYQLRKPDFQREM